MTDEMPESGSVPGPAPAPPPSEPPPVSPPSEPPPVSPPSAPPPSTPVQPVAKPRIRPPSVPFGPRPPMPKPLLRTSEGKRVIFYVFILVAAALIMYGPWRKKGATKEGDLPDSTASVGPVVKIKRLEAPKPEAGGAGASREVPFHGMLDDVQDYTPLEPDFAYAYLVDYVQRLTDEELARLVEPKLGFQMVLDDPVAARGRIVRVIGMPITEWTPIRFDPDVRPATATGEDAWRAYIVDPSGTECYAVDLLEKPPAVELRRDVVEVEGAFLKVLSYNTKQGKERFIPFIVARQAKPVTEERLERPFRWDIAAVVAAGAFVLVLGGYAFWRSRHGDQPDPAKVAATVARMKERAQEARDKAAGPPPSTDVPGPAPAPNGGAV